MMQQGLGFIHVINAYRILSMPEVQWNVQHLQVEMVSIVCGVYTTQCVDR